VKKGRGRLMTQAMIAIAADPEKGKGRTYARRAQKDRANTRQGGEEL